MTLFLAMDTATDYGSVAVGEPGTVAAELPFAKRRHATVLVPSIMEVLRLAGRGLGDLSGIVVADGPGSFTGLRIGFSTAFGIQRQFPSIALITTPSLLCTAFGVRQRANGSVAALYDALRGDVFGAVYSFKHDLVESELEPTMATVGGLREQCTSTPVLAVGDGALLYSDEVHDWTGNDPLGPPESVPRAGSLIELLAVEGATRRIADPTSFNPTYGRLAEAQVRLGK